MNDDGTESVSLVLNVPRLRDGAGSEDRTQKNRDCLVGLPEFVAGDGLEKGRNTA